MLGVKRRLQPVDPAERLTDAAAHRESAVVAQDQDPASGTQVTYQSFAFVFIQRRALVIVVGQPESRRRYATALL